MVKVLTLLVLMTSSLSTFAASFVQYGATGVIANNMDRNEKNLYYIKRDSVFFAFKMCDDIEIPAKGNVIATLEHAFETQKTVHINYVDVVRNPKRESENDRCIVGAELEF
jgi:hypothetical protein